MYCFVANDLWKSDNNNQLDNINWLPLHFLVILIRGHNISVIITITEHSIFHHKSVVNNHQFLPCYR